MSFSDDDDDDDDDDDTVGTVVRNVLPQNRCRE